MEVTRLMQKTRKMSYYNAEDLHIMRSHVSRYICAVFDNVCTHTIKHNGVQVIQEIVISSVT